MKRLIMAVLLALSVVSCNTDIIERDSVSADVLEKVMAGEGDTLIVYPTVDQQMHVDALAMYDTKGIYKGTIPTQVNTFLGIFILSAVAFVGFLFGNKGN